MAEIISVHVGQCGSQVGSQFWQMLHREHGLDQTGLARGEKTEQLHRISTYFSEEERTGRFRPRSVLVDLQPGLGERTVGQAGHCVTGSSGAANTWARAHYGPEAAGLRLEVSEVVRREAEQCDLLQGFQLSHALAGGSGSGLGSLLLEDLRDHFPARILNTFSVFPSSSASTGLVEPYNAGLTLPHLLQFSQGVFCADNLALTKICSNKLNISSPAFSHLNHLVARMMSGVSGPLRYPSSARTDLRKMVQSLVPHPGLHFFISSLAPLSPSQPQPGVERLLADLYDGAHLLSDCDLRRARHLTVNTIVQGNTSGLQLSHLITSMMDTTSERFVPWIWDNVMVNTCQTDQISGCQIANSTAIAQPLRVISGQFSELWRRKAFLHNFTSEGMEEAEFASALGEMKDLISQYEDCEEAAGDDVTETETESEYSVTSTEIRQN